MPTNSARTGIAGERWSASLAPKEGTIYENVDFDELVIQNVVLRRVQFINCRFKHCRFGFNVRYEDCLWDKCKFTSQHTSFGPSGVFEQCIFTHCLVQGCSVDGASFNGCSIGGSLKNLTIRGERSSKADIVCRFTNCDISQAKFSNTNFILGVELGSVKLPVSGIRVFNNQEECLRLALIVAAKATKNKIVSSSLEFLIPADGQSLVVLDPDYMSKMLDSKESLSIFNEIASKYEVRCAATA
jgi:hypothetical protein